MIDGFTVHDTITESRVIEALEADPMSVDEPGFCLACGAAEHVPSPDTHKFFCSDCGAFAVIGANELFMELA